MIEGRGGNAILTMRADDEQVFQQGFVEGRGRNASMLYPRRGYMNVSINIGCSRPDTQDSSGWWKLVPVMET